MTVPPSTSNNTAPNPNNGATPPKQRPWIKPVIAAACMMSIYVGWQAFRDPKWNIVDAKFKNKRFSYEADSLKIIAVSAIDKKDTLYGSWPVNGIEQSKPKTPLWNKSEERAVLSDREVITKQGVSLQDPDIDNWELYEIRIQEKKSGEYADNDAYFFKINKTALEKEGKLDVYRNISKMFTVPNCKAPGTIYMGQGIVKEPSLWQRLNNKIR